MGLTKDYLRYTVSDKFGQISGNKANIVVLHWRGTDDRYCATGVVEDIIVWDLRTGNAVLRLKGDKFEVSILRQSSDSRNSFLAAGYTDGSIKIFNLTTGQCNITFNGHKSAVSALNYNKEGFWIVSGGKDSAVVVWDIVNESGLYRLKDHKGLITQARFMEKQNILITSSKDTFVKFWDLDTQHCFKTLVAHRAEVWDFVLLQNERLLVTGSADSELRVWILGPKENGPTETKKIRLEKSDELVEDDEDEQLTIKNQIDCKKFGSVMRQGRERVVSLETDLNQTVLACHGASNTLELFRVSTDEERLKRVSKRQKKARKRASSENEEAVLSDDPQVEDDIRAFNAIRMKAKIKSVAIKCIGDKTKAFTTHANNSVQFCSVPSNVRHAAPMSDSLLCAPGHRSDVRALAWSSDNTAILSASGDQAKVWNRSSLQCIRTLPCGYALSCVFAPGDRHVLIATKAGTLQLFDLAAGQLLEELEAHSGAAWCLDSSPDQRSIVSGSADKTVKFWDWEFITDPQYSETAKRLSLLHTRTLNVDEDVLCLKHSPDKKLLAVSQLDNTVKVFYRDSLKFFLSLYGHKLPVLAMDISFDSKLIITASADKNVKIWGLDFGDCHRSLFAHDDSVMCVQFIPKTHLFFSGGKDNEIKQWDADIFENITTLEGHHGEIWALAVSPSGNFMTSASHDKSLRLWEKTEEPLILSEERENEREREDEEAIAQRDGESVVAGEHNAAVGLASRKTVESVKAAERLMEALQLHAEEAAKHKEHEAEALAAGKEVAPLPLHPLVTAYNADSIDRYVLEVLKRVKSSELEEGLLVMPFNYVTKILRLLHRFLEAGWETELCCRCLLFLLKIHHGQIISSKLFVNLVDKLGSTVLPQVAELKHRMGFNLVALRTLQRKLEERDQVQLFTDATNKAKERKKKRKQSAAILTVT